MALHPNPNRLSGVKTDDPIELSTRIIDTGATDEPTNRVSNRLSEIDDDIAVVESFSHMVTFRTDDGLVSFDTGTAQNGQALTDALRGWRTDRIHSLVYTHGHVDHVGGSGALLADNDARGHAPPAVIGHENVTARFDRYRETNGWNLAINRRQFGGVSPRHGLGLSDDLPDFVPAATAEPTVTYRDHLTVHAGGLTIELHHARGETDDHTWAWVPSHRAICPGDLVTWVFPNAGNPQKVQRYPGAWAAELRTMMALDAELLLPAHGLPIRGRDRINRVLDDLATALEGLVRDTVALMNDGASLNEILHTVRVPDDLLSRPWLTPVYDEPEFVVRNIWRLYGGWWDGDAAQLKPPTTAAVGTEVAALAGGTAKLVARAQQLADAGDHRLACQLVEFAAAAAPDDPVVHGARAELYRARRGAESSLMSKGIFAAAARESEAIIDAP